MDSREYLSEAYRLTLLLAEHLTTIAGDAETQKREPETCRRCAVEAHTLLVEIETLGSQIKSNVCSSSTS